MPIEKKLSSFSNNSSKCFLSISLACSFTASRRFAAAVPRIVSHRWSKRSIKMIGYKLTSWPATATGLKNIAKLDAIVLQPITVIFALSFTRGNTTQKLIRGNQYHNFLISIPSEFPLDSRKMTHFENFLL